MSRIIEKYKKTPVQVRASLWFLICSFLQKGISVLTTPIFTRLLDTTQYGLYGAFDSWLGIMTIFISMRLSFGVYLQGLVKFSDERSIFSSSLQGLTLTLTLIWTVIYLLFHDFWNQLLALTTVQVLAALVMIWCTAVFSFWCGEQRVQYKYRNLVIVTVISSIAKPLVSILLVTHAEDKVTARILGLMIVELALYPAFFIVQMRRGKVFYSKKYWKYALMFNLPLIPHYLSQVVLTSSDRLMIKAMVGPSETGIYTLAYKLSQIMTLFNTALSQTLTPWMYSKIKEKKESDITRIGMLALLIVCTVNLLLIAAAPEVLYIFAPAKYHEAIYAIPPVAMAVVFSYSYDLFAKFEFYYEKTKIIMIASVTGAAANVLLNYLLIPKFGYIAAAYTTLFCYMMYSLAHYTMMRRVCKANGSEPPYSGKGLIWLFGAFLIFGFTLLATYRFTIVRYCIIAAAVAVLIIFRSRIMKVLKELMQLKKKKGQSA